MAKQKTAFFCQNCGTESPKWVGKCPSCGEWNTFVEELKSNKDDVPAWKSQNGAGRNAQPVLIGEIKAEEFERYSTRDGELDRVLGGGVVNGSLVLIGGEPGIGKSTLLLQLALQVSHKKILYVSGEESPQQIKMRADRLSSKSENCFLLSETSLESIFEQLVKLEPDLLVIDSIQTLHSDRSESAPGSVSQVRECTGQLMQYAKQNQIPIFLIGHINKEGSIAGPKVLEHMVDTVLQFEGDRNMVYRILRTIKNRFGSTSELGIYKMNADGLEQVKNPSEILLTGEHQHSGVAVGASLEGNRPLLIEVQALVSPAAYSSPQRSTTGFDVKRLHMLLAVLERRMGIRLSNQDVFLNITGGIKINDTSLDLAVCAAVYSSYHDLELGEGVCLIGEVGLGGELRRVSQMEKRISEAEKLGFKQTLVAAGKQSIKSSKIEVVSKKMVKEAFSVLF